MATTRLARLASHLTPQPTTSLSSSYTLKTPSGNVTFPNDFLRENIKKAWDKNSLQRVDHKMWNDNTVTSSSQLTDTSWELRFGDGTVGEFHLPVSSPHAEKDIEIQPKLIWGFGESTHHNDILRTLTSRHSEGKGGIRFHWNEMGIAPADDTSSPSAQLAAEQLGEGRARLSPSVAHARAALIEATNKYGMAIIDHVPCIPDQGLLLADSVVGAVETTNFGCVVCYAFFIFFLVFLPLTALPFHSTSTPQLQVRHQKRPRASQSCIRQHPSPASHRLHLLPQMS